MDLKEKAATLGMRYISPGTVEKVIAGETEPYYFETYAGAHSITVQRGDCVFWLSADSTTAFLNRGPTTISSPRFATVVRGFAPENKSSTIVNKTVLPYTNGCSTKQIFPSDRPGDPTLQLLLIPPHTTEQVHHIHSTARSVFILSGHGRSQVGMRGDISIELTEGMVCILDRMCPHHFETQDVPLLVLPVHVWSSVGNAEHEHPMVHGTFRV
jgi:mannose-6-phosphate isomerase-like protein (cupin superfamily)